jgi:predicted metalloendopeptidase
MPDRDYYLKSDDRFKDARDKYRVHVANIFKLAGYSDADAKTASDTVFSSRPSLREFARQCCPTRPTGNRPQDHIR